MKLADLRKLSIRQQIKIHFQLPNGLECVVNEHGVARVPALRNIPDFNLERDLEAAGEFFLEPAVVDPKATSRMRIVSRDELAAMAATGPASASEHEEE
jgi:hypothetical protein